MIEDGVSLPDLIGCENGRETAVYVYKVVSRRLVALMNSTGVNVLVSPEARAEGRRISRMHR